MKEVPFSEPSLRAIAPSRREKDCVLAGMILFLFLWILGYDFWIFPNLFDESLSVVDSFKRVARANARKFNASTIPVFFSLFSKGCLEALCLRESDTTFDGDERACGATRMGFLTTTLDQNCDAAILETVPSEGPE